MYTPKPCVRYSVRVTVSELCHSTLQRRRLERYNYRDPTAHSTLESRATVVSREISTPPLMTREMTDVRSADVLTVD